MSELQKNDITLVDGGRSQSPYFPDQSWLIEQLRKEADEILNQEILGQLN